MRAEVPGVRERPLPEPEPLPVQVRLRLGRGEDRVRAELLVLHGARHLHLSGGVHLRRGLPETPHVLGPLRAALPQDVPQRLLRGTEHVRMLRGLSPGQRLEERVRAALRGDVREREVRRAARLRVPRELRAAPGGHAARLPLRQVLRRGRWEVPLPGRDAAHRGPAAVRGGPGQLLRAREVQERLLQDAVRLRVPGRLREGQELDLRASE